VARVERIVFIKWNDDDADLHARRAGRAHEVLAALPDVREFRVLRGVDEKSRKDWDLCLRLAFDDATAVSRFVDDPRHRSWVDDELRPKLAVIKAWNFDDA